MVGKKLFTLILVLSNLLQFRTSKTCWWSAGTASFSTSAKAWSACPPTTTAKHALCVNDYVTLCNRLPGSLPCVLSSIKPRKASFSR